ncbi:MAG: OmpA family protein, partial [Gemmatimonadota bacterium]|nr:OmpA family protein [Gemmatimonadota bacterium]
MTGLESCRTPAQGDPNDRAARDAESAAAERAPGATRATLEAPVYFSFDGFDLDAEAGNALDDKIHILQQNPGVRILISGHSDERGSDERGSDERGSDERGSDERGSDEYNLSLGPRRAAAARRYLTQNGIDGSRVELVSYGEEQALCRTTGEDCWSRNRRAVFAITAG